MQSEVNPYSSPGSGDSKAKRAPWSPKSFGEAIGGGAWRGLKWTTYITAPIAVFLEILFIACIVFLALKNPRQMPSLRLLGNPIGFYLSSCLWGVLIGVFIGVKRYFVSRLWSRDHVMTAKDAGWRKGSVFVAPMTFIPIDPPEPRKRPSA